jgi:VIT1/CCC1 family predicted Fe2+/Mn2+ transporter
MNPSLKIGFGFGLTSGVITTLGLMVGLHAGAHSKIVVLGGVLTIAIADAFSDALGIHLSEEWKQKHNPKEVWQATLATFLSKFFFTSSFILPILLFSLPKAIFLSIIWGMLLLGIFSFFIAKEQKTGAAKIIVEHLGIALLVILISRWVGNWVSINFS